MKTIPSGRIQNTSTTPGSADTAATPLRGSAPPGERCDVVDGVVPVAVVERRAPRVGENHPVRPDPEYLDDTRLGGHRGHAAAGIGAAGSGATLLMGLFQLPLLNAGLLRVGENHPVRPDPEYLDDTRLGGHRGHAAAGIGAAGERCDVVDGVVPVAVVERRAPRVGENHPVRPDPEYLDCVSGVAETECRTRALFERNQREGIVQVRSDNCCVSRKIAVE